MIQEKSIRLIPILHIVVQRFGVPATRRRHNTKQITVARERVETCRPPCACVTGAGSPLEGTRGWVQSALRAPPRSLTERPEIDHCRAANPESVHVHVMNDRGCLVT
jgi:hypothetical protein